MILTEFQCPVIDAICFVSQAQIHYVGIRNKYFVQLISMLMSPDLVEIPYSNRYAKRQIKKIPPESTLEKNKDTWHALFRMWYCGRQSRRLATSIACLLFNYYICWASYKAVFYFTLSKSHARFLNRLLETSMFARGIESSPWLLSVFVLSYV